MIFSDVGDIKSCLCPVLLEVPFQICTPSKVIKHVSILARFNILLWFGPLILPISLISNTYNIIHGISSLIVDVY